jgi:hypothetical protein
MVNNSTNINKANYHHETNYPHDSILTKRFAVKITVERCNKIKVAVLQIFDRVKSICGHDYEKKV